MAQLFVLCFMYSTAASPVASSCSSSFEQLTPPKLRSKRARFADAVHNSTAEVQPARSVWDLIVFGFELEMLKVIFFRLMYFFKAADLLHLPND